MIRFSGKSLPFWWEVPGGDAGLAHAQPLAQVKRSMKSQQSISLQFSWGLFSVLCLDMSMRFRLPWRFLAYLGAARPDPAGGLTSVYARGQPGGQARKKREVSRVIRDPSKSKEREAREGNKGRAI